MDTFRVCTGGVVPRPLQQKPNDVLVALPRSELHSLPLQAVRMARVQRPLKQQAHDGLVPAHRSELQRHATLDASINSTACRLVHQQFTHAALSPISAERTQHVHRRM
jgi:hypothetical protein